MVIYMKTYYNLNSCEGDIKRLYEKPLPSKRSGALYNAFSYPTKISPEAIALFIATHTKPGDTVLDTFSGSGTTGLATLLCDKPTEEMIRLAKEFGLSPKWGPRKAVLYDISTLGTFISHTMCMPPNPDEFEKAANKLIKKAEEKIGWFWEAIDPVGNIGRIRYAIWSDVLKCKYCGKETTFWDAVVRFEPLRIEDTFECNQCHHIMHVEEIERVFEPVYDEIIDKQILRKKRVIVRIYGQTKGNTWKRDVCEGDIENFERVRNYQLPKCAPIQQIVWGDLHRAGYHKGITHLHHFYTMRNFIAISVLWDLITEFPENIQNALKMLVLSYNASHSTLMTRIVVKNGQGDFVVTGAQPGVLYISSLPVEKNVLEGIRRKIKTLKNAFTSVYESKSFVKVVNQSSTKINLPDSSVEYVFTDPPFGDYIPYAEINQINEAWLGKLTIQKDEIVISEAQGKSVKTYGNMMKSVFNEINRVLKPDGKVTVVFHSAKAEVWSALMNAYSDAGFKIETTSILNKLQSSFKQVVSTVSVKGDPLLLLSKNKSDYGSQNDTFTSTDDIFQEVIEKARESDDKNERSVQRLYSRYVSRCLELGVSVSLNADIFYKKIRAAEGYI